MHFTSRDVDRVEQTWKQFVPSAALQRVDVERFRFDWSSGELGSVAIIRYDLAAQVQSVAQPDEQLLICRVDATDAEVSSGRDTLDAAQPWLSDGARVNARWHHEAQVRALVIDREAAEARVRQITGDDRLTLRSTSFAPKNDAAARDWERMFSYVDDALAGTSGNDILAAELERHALTVSLSVFPTTALDSLAKPAQRRAAPNSVRRALTFIEENAHRPITIDDVAAAAYISTRGLQYAFRRSMDMTPAEYLRRERLQGAHRDLGERDAGSIATIARRWGFSHPSRFAAAYREAYGVAPSATVERTRR